jgi:hypothetical protein
MFGLPLGTVAALLVVTALPLLAYGLYRIDVTRGDGRPALFGRSSDEA